jgi:hypothetical protein
MLVRFITDADSSDAGWDASYYTEPPSYCSGVKIMTMAADSFTDGSGDYNYNNRSNCKWLIKPEDADIIKLHFNSFDTEPGMDILKVVDPTKEPPQVLGYFSGNEIPPDITVNNGQMLIIFITDNANRHSGWSAEYSSSSNINEFSILNSQFSIYPNPALNNITLNLKSRILTSDSQVRFNIVNALGQTVKSLLFNSKHSATFDISDLPKGMYNVMALTGQRIINEKLIIE